MAGKSENEEQSRQEQITTYFPFKEIYFLGLASQSNVYCCVKLEPSALGFEKLLVGSLGGKVSCIDCSDSNKPNAKEVYFTYIPGDAEIISMDAFSRIKNDNDVCGNDSLVVAISLVLVKNNNGNKKYQHFLNVYTAMEPEKDHKLADIARSCQHIELNFTPYQLTHANIHVIGEGKMPVFLLSGSDKKMHLFREERLLQKFVEFPCEEFFPEFKDLPSSVTWLSMKETPDNKRITAFGCQNGYVGLAVVDSNSDILKSYSICIEGPISSVRLFSLKTRKNSTNSVKTDKDNEDAKKSVEVIYGFEDLCLLVTSAMELSVIYQNVTEQGFANMAILPRSDHFDCVTCSMIADFDCDGNNEIILGTYGQELLVYKFYPSNFDNGTLHFDLRWTRTFPKPIFRVEMVDLLNDGVMELIVVSLTGVHILQCDADLVSNKLLENIETKFERLLKNMCEHDEQIPSEAVH